MDVKLRNELTYLMIFYSLKRLFENGDIDKDTFDRLNIKNAESQGCKVAIIWQIAHWNLIWFLNRICDERRPERWKKYKLSIPNWAKK